MLDFHTELDSFSRIICVMADVRFAEYGRWLTTVPPTGGGGGFGAGWCLQEVERRAALSNGSEEQFFSTDEHVVVLKNGAVVLEDLASDDRVSPPVDLKDFILLLKEWDSIDSFSEIEKLRVEKRVHHAIG